MKTLKSLSVLTAAVLSNSLSLNAASDAANKPNFVIIFCDDMGYGDLSCYGNPTIRTPNIDRMACEGMKLTQFYVGAGVSTPSRAALMTGRLPVRNGLYGDRVAVLFPNSKAGLGHDRQGFTTKRVCDRLCRQMAFRSVLSLFTDGSWF